MPLFSMCCEMGSSHGVCGEGGLVGETGEEIHYPTVSGVGRLPARG
jgi:hypothetical protein